MAIGLAEVDGLVDLAVGRGLGGAGDVNDHITRDIYRQYKIVIQLIAAICVSTLLRPKTPLIPSRLRSYLKRSEVNIRYKKGGHENNDQAS